MHSEARYGVVPALPLAAALSLLVARTLPLHFEYRPNPHGIVSAATELRHPQQLETFYWVFGLLAGSLLTWGLARALGRRAPAPETALGVEAAAAAALLAVLWLPLAPGWACAAAGGAAALRLAGRSRGPEASSPAPRARRAPPAAGAAWALGVLLLATLLTPGLSLRLWNVAQGVPDDLLVRDQFTFLAETGQHLAWANALRAGALHGRDFFCLYGPLYDLGLVGLWALVGRSIAAWELYVSLGRALSWAALLLLAGALVRRRWLALLPVFLLPWINLRVGLPLFGLLFLGRSLDGGRAWAAAAGAAAGLSLLYSQESGAALVVAAGGVLCLRADPARLLAFGMALLASIAPLAGYYASQGALLALLQNLSEYPGYVLAGFGALPFPGIGRSLMLDAWSAGREASLVLRLGYAVPAVCLGALLLALPVSALDPRRPWGSLRGLFRELRADSARLAVVGVGVFGLVSFRSALGRSDLNHVLAVLPSAALLLAVGFDRLFDLWSRGAAWRRLAIWRAAALGLFVLHAGFLQTTSPLSLVARSLENASGLLQRVPLASGDPQVMRVARYVQRRTEPGEPVLFLPNDAAYYYLADRPNAVRFVVGHQMVTRAHRAEALAALRARPPRYLVWNHASHRVDGLPDEKVFGSALLEWIDASYETERRIGPVEILRLRGAGAP